MMSDSTKKISFGFSKLAKKTSIVSTTLNKNKQDDEVSKVEFIDCLEGKSIKLKDPIKQDTGPLVIPLSRIKEESTASQKVNSVNVGVDIIDNKLETPSIAPDKSDGKIINGSQVVNDNSKIDCQNKKETLDEIAAREILEELNRNKAENEEKRVFSVPLTSNAPLGEKESTLDDYDNVPVVEFGMAMLRGMGWAPGKGIGKNEKLVAPSLPAPRPKGMGLGADKVIKSVEKKSTNEDLKMVKGSFIRVVAGSEKDSYGQIEGFDDESGRLIVKLALKNVSVSLNEFMVQLVDSTEYKKNSKVLNASKYEEYKRSEGKEGTRLQAESNKHSQESKSKDQALKSNISNDSQHKRRSNSESEDDSKAKVSSKKHASSSDKYGRSLHRSSRSPHENVKSRDKSPSSTRHKQKSEYPNKYSTNMDKKHRSYSSDSASSGSDNYKYVRVSSNKPKSDSTKGKRSARDTSSSSSSSSDSSGHYSRKKSSKHKKKKSSSNKYRSRSRSRSPRKSSHKRSKKH